MRADHRGTGSFGNEVVLSPARRRLRDVRISAATTEAETMPRNLNEPRLVARKIAALFQALDDAHVALRGSFAQRFNAWL